MAEQQRRRFRCVTDTKAASGAWPLVVEDDDGR